jgi:hypothetical protein
MKICTKCNIKKDFIEFHKHPTCLDGFVGTCKSCKKKYEQNYRFNNRELLAKKQREYCLNNKEKITEYGKLYHLNNKEKLIEKSKLWIKNNKEKRINWLKDNKNQINEKANEYQKQRKKIDPLFKLRTNISSLIFCSIKRQGYLKKSKTYKYLGCTFDEFKIHIEKQFTKGMNWENQGQWHLDHIYPVSLAKDEEELIRLNHYTNFQPLWALDNIRKSNKIIEQQLILI